MGNAHASLDLQRGEVLVGDVDEREPLAEARFVLAQVLWLADAQRPDARHQTQLAMHGFDHMEEFARTAREKRSRVQRWLDDVTSRP